MPGTFRSKEWLSDRASRLKPKAFSASSASGGERNLPSCVDCSFSITVASKFVNITSPFSNGDIVATAVGVLTRISDRIIDCPVKVMLSVGDCGHTAVPMLNTMARQVAGSRTRPHFNFVAICVLLQAVRLEKTAMFGRYPSAGQKVTPSETQTQEFQSGISV